MVLKVFLSGFPHSEISGSRDICSSPKLFAAYHVFHRLLVPRHPPCALISLTNSPSLSRVLKGWVPVHSVAPVGFCSGCPPPHGFGHLCLSLGCFFPYGFRHKASDVLNICHILWYSFQYVVFKVHSDWILSVISKLDHSNSLITGKNQLYGTALPCWSRLTCLFHLCRYHRLHLHLHPLRHVRSI